MRTVTGQRSPDDDEEALAEDEFVAFTKGQGPNGPDPSLLPLLVFGFLDESLSHGPFHLR